MNGHRRRSTQGHDNYATQQHLNVPQCFDRSGVHDFGYDASTPYNLRHHPFNPYTPQFPSSYSQPSALIPSTVDSQSSSIRPISQVPPQNITHTQGLQHQGQYYMSPSRYQYPSRYYPLCDTFNETEIESQESLNEDTMLSEPVIPPLEGFPNVEEFDRLMKRNSYVGDLSVKKQDKALIHARRARNIKTVLMDPKDTAIESAQFRFWVKKMFKLQPVDTRASNSKQLICHEGKPVAIREKLFKILTKAHQQCQHGGRDKTSAQVRRVYSWVPKELISRFVKICPTCQVRRGGSRLSPPNSPSSSLRFETPSRSPSIHSPSTSSRESTFSRLALTETSQADTFMQNPAYVGWTESHLQGQLGITSAGLVPPFSVRSVGLPTNPTLSTLNPLINETSTTSAQTSNYNGGYVSSQGGSRHHNY